MAVSEEMMYLWLSASGITSRRFNKLMEKYALPELWEGVKSGAIKESEIGEKYSAVLRFCDETYLQMNMMGLDKSGVSFLPYNRFPQKLAEKEVCPPPVLYYRGNLKLLEEKSIAIVGTRNCTSYGKEVATRFATDLCACNLVIISGLATGIDTYAHRAAVKCGGKTIAVLGSGIQQVTPVGNFALSNEIVSSGGLVVSEFLPNMVATKYTFPERNRIISALSEGVIVVEAGERSGALITSEFAAEQGRTVFAVPGNITSSRSLGTNRLIYDGATPALTAEDICDVLRLPMPAITKNTRVIQLDIFEQKIYNILISGDESFDSLVVKAEIAPPKLSALLSSLEIKGVIKRKQSNTYGLNK